MARKRKKSGGGLGEGANWMDTYGDMVTLLLTFFVLLFSFSTIDAVKWEQLVGSFNGAGTSFLTSMNIEQVVQQPIALEINTQSKDNSDSTNVPNQEALERDLENFLKLVENLQVFIDKNGISAELYPVPETLTVTLRFQDNILFDSGDATIKTEAKPLIANLAEVIAENAEIIEEIGIEGHTDTDPISTAEFMDNWDLSAKRANNTLRELLLNDKMDPTFITPSGLSEYHPVADNDSSDGKAKNRRVDFVIQGVVTA